MGKGKPARKRSADEQRRRAAPVMLLPLLVLAVLGLAAYWNSLDVPLVFDDLITIQKNPGVQFGDVFSPGLFSTRPVLYFTFALNYRWHVERVFGYHLVSMILHILNAFMVFFIARHILSRAVADSKLIPVYSFVAAAFFLLHPVQTESVTYVASRSELLSTFFYALALLLFIKRDESKIGFLWSLVVAVPFFLGLLSKETVISLPAVLLLYDYLFIARTDVRSLIRRSPFYATFVAGGIVAGYGLLKYVLAGSVGSGLEGHLSSWQYLLTQTRVIVRYIQLLFFPVGLNLDYDIRPSTSLLEPAVLASGAVIAALIAAAWRLRRRHPVLSFAIFFFFIALAPTSSFVPILDVIFEHRLYLPLAGACLAFPLLIELALRQIQTPAWLQPRHVCLAILPLLLTLTVLRNNVWSDDIRLWSDTVAKSPSKARPHNSLALAYFKRGDYAKAIQAVSLGRERATNPLEKRAFAETIGNLYLKTGQYDQALEAFHETAQVDDARLASVAYNNIGVTYLYKLRQLEGMQARTPTPRFAEERAKLLADAEGAFQQGLGKDPGMFGTFDSYINVASDRGRRAELEQEFHAVLKTKEDYKAYYGLGKLAFNAAPPDYARAVEYFEKAKKLNPGQKLLFFNDGYALDQLGRTDDAIQSYLQAIRTEPLFGEAHHNVALLYMKKSDFDSALKHFQDALRLDPRNVSTHLNMARIYARLSRAPLACQHLTQVLDVSPGHKDATALWGQTGCGNRTAGAVDISGRNQS